MKHLTGIASHYNINVHVLYHVGTAIVSGDQSVWNSLISLDKSSLVTRSVNQSVSLDYTSLWSVGNSVTAMCHGRICSL